MGFFILIVCCSCRVNKEKNKVLHTDRQIDHSLQSNSTWGQFNSWDSSYRYWHFSGDSGFFFHPDFGLWGHTGQLTYGEQVAVQKQILEMAHDYDDVSREKSSTESQIYSKKASTLLLKWLWLLLAIPAGGAVYWYWRKFL